MKHNNKTVVSYTITCEKKDIIEMIDNEWKYYKRDLITFDHLVGFIDAFSTFGLLDKEEVAEIYKFILEN